MNTVKTMAFRQMSLWLRSARRAAVTLAVVSGGVLIPIASGCGGGEAPPPMGSEKFEAEKKAYREIRGKEYGRKSIEPAKGKASGKRG